MPNGVTFSPPQPPAPLTNVLTDTHIFVGDAANVPQDVALTLNATGGSFALANTGVLTMPNADTATRGLLTAADWNTFNGKLNNSLNDTNIFVGNALNKASGVALTLNATGGAFALANTGVLTMPNANATTRGLLTAADWNTFNNKQNALQYWSESYNAVTQATSAWSATGAAVNINAAIRPQGTGAILAQIPDGAITGGNARGVNAVDFQRVRGLGANRVATGERSFIGNGENNSVSGRNSAVLCGDNNSISGNNSGIVAGTTNSIAGADQRSIIGAGNSNSITGFPSSVGILSGQSNTANASYAFIGGGQTNTASGSHSSVIGGIGNTSSGYAAISGGENCVASGSYTVALGTGCTTNSEGSIAIGRGCSANNPGQRGMIAMGNGCTTTYEGGVAMGANCGTSNFGAVALGQANSSQGTGSLTSGREALAVLHGQKAHAANQFSAKGDAQAHELIWRRVVTGAPVGGTELFLDGSSAAAILPSTNAIWHGIIDIAAICTATGNGTTVTGDVEATSYKVTIKRIGTTTSLVGTVQEIGTTNADTSMASGVFTIDNNDTNESLRIVYTSPVTAGSTTTIRVVATFRGLQIQY